ncbi:hypothetical protein EFY87_04705 [Flexivirga caeni]|uniref:Uncharacterized protein n=1 Tax=Flexivirga caeni TaxID=2294115 RepID=A0A3M9MHD3_9MICO|nr:hypothetical protein EFY87_04705 [Flexivirga caeni]
MFPTADAVRVAAVDAIVPWLTAPPGVVAVQVHDTPGPIGPVLDHDVCFAEKAPSTAWPDASVTAIVRSAAEEFSTTGAPNAIVSPDWPATVTVGGSGAAVVAAGVLVGFSLASWPDA